MFKWFTARSGDQRKAEQLYGTVVAAARNGDLFRASGVPDTAEGRYEVLCLMLFLAVDRLQAEGAGGEAQAQRLIEVFVGDMDDCLRELGVGDLTVPKKVRKAAAGFYERGAAYRAALRLSDPNALAAVISDKVFDGPLGAPAHLLADYVRKVRAAHLAATLCAAEGWQMTFPPFPIHKETAA